MSLRGLTRWLEHASAVLEQAMIEDWSPERLDAALDVMGRWLASGWADDK